MTKALFSSNRFDDSSESIRRAKDRALRFLSSRPHSVNETVLFLQRKSCDAEVISSVIETLIELKFLDDRQFASWWIESRCRAKPSGPLRLAAELKQKGIEKSVISELTNLDYHALARKAAAEFSSRSSEKNSQKRKQKLIGFLQRRGFTWPHISAVLHA